MMTAAGAWAKPITVEYYDGQTFESDTSCIGHTLDKGGLIDVLVVATTKDDVSIDCIEKVDLEQYMEEMVEQDKAFFETILDGPYTYAYIESGSVMAVWFVTHEKEVYYVQFSEKIEGDEENE